MTANQSRLLGLAILLSAIAVAVHFARSGDAAESLADQAARDALAKKAELEQMYASSKARFDGGAFVARTKRISESEDIELIVIPEGYTEELDTRCVVYKNSELRTSSIACSGILFREPAPPS